MSLKHGLTVNFPVEVLFVLPESLDHKCISVIQPLHPIAFVKATYSGNPSSHTSKIAYSSDFDKPRNWAWSDCSHTLPSMPYANSGRNPPCTKPVLHRV